MIKPSQSGGLLGKFYPVDAITRMVRNVPLDDHNLSMTEWVEEQGGRLHTVQGYRPPGSDSGQNGYLVYLTSSGHLLFKLAWHNV